MCRSRYVPLALLVTASLTLTACDGSPAGETAVPVDQPGLLAACVLAPVVEFSGTAGALGATFQGGGVAIAIPAGALAADTDFRIEVPSSQYAEVEIRANGQKHFQFLLPVMISISYDRCDTPEGPLTAWHIDPDTKALLENMGGVNDPLNSQVTFSTMHLSGYAIAN